MLVGVLAWLGRPVECHLVPSLADPADILQLGFSLVS